MTASDWRFHFGEHRGAYAAAAMFVVIFTLYIANHQTGWTTPVLTTAANKAVLLAVVAMAQTLPVLTSGIDLSVGMVFVLTNCLASHLVVGTPVQAGLGVVAVLAVGALCGWINGAIIVYGRLQPIITTLATGTVYFGLALGLTMLVVLLAVVLLIWVPYRRSPLGRAALAIGSSEAAAYMSGVNIGRTKIVTYTLAGLLAGIGGLLLTFVTYSGEASSAIGGVYTLNSIAAVVIGGTSLAGGAGSAIGSIFGALVLRTIGDLLFVFDLEPLWQPLFQGIILLTAVSLGALRLLKVSNRLDVFK
jgi:ribose transport system permease protein